MTIEEARRILSVTGNEDRTIIKKRYRQLMLQVHPDVIGTGCHSYPYSAHEINEAYEVCSRHFYGHETIKETVKHTTPSDRWNAPVNENAYSVRDIFLDHVAVATGKYYYTPDEGLQMFLLSIYRCSQKLLEGFPDQVIRKYHPEMAYLLSLQFTDREQILREYEITSEPGKITYYFPAMLETEGKRCALKPGTVLVPSGVRNHKLYLAFPDGREQGYVSFADDRIYYALVPLFEQRLVELKIQVSGTTQGNNRVRAVKVRTLDLWIRMLAQTENKVSLTISSRIESLLQRCREEDSN